MAQITGGSSHLKRYRLKIGPPTFSDLIKKKENPTQMYPGTCSLVNSIYSQVDKREYSSQSVS